MSSNNLYSLANIKTAFSRVGETDPTEIGNHKKKISLFNTERNIPLEEECDDEEQNPP